MPAIITSRTRTQQPQGVVAICGGLREIAVVGMHPLPFPMDPVRGGLLTITAGTSDIRLPGRARAHTATTDRVQLLSAAESNLLCPTTQCTVFVYHQKRDSTSRANSNWGINNTADNGRFEGACPYTNTDVFFDFGGPTDGVTRKYAGGVYGTVLDANVWAFSTGPRGMEIWKAGVVVASNAATPTRVNAAQPLELGNSPNGASELLNWYGFLLLNKQLDQADIRSISQNFWQIYRPMTRRYYLPGAVATSTAAASRFFLAQ